MTKRQSKQEIIEERINAEKLWQELPVTFCVFAAALTAAIILILI